MFKKILLAFDGSATSNRALDYANDLASKYGAEIILLQAYPILPVEILSPSAAQVQAEVITASEKIVQAAETKLKGMGVAVTSELVQGPPAEAILRVAQARGCDLIVVGSRGLGEITGVLLGSVSNKVLHHASVPVLVVK